MNEQHAMTDEPIRHAAPSALIHDLRTPLNLIIGYSDLMIEQAQDEAQNSFGPDLKKVHDAGLQLLGLIDSSFYPVPDGQLTAVAAPPEARGAYFDFPEADPLVLDLTLVTHEHLVLVVDDIEANRDVLSRRLKRDGYKVATAENGESALAMLHDQSFDLVLLDIMMPVLDGYGVLSILKADDRLRHVPVIMISALSELDSVARCIEMGAEDYLTKPFNPTLLKARVGACLSKKVAHDREADLFAKLEENYRRLQKLEILRDDLTNMIIHDLRTPLASVIAGMQTLDILGDLNADQREMMGISIVGGQTLLGMINDLLDVEKLESGTMELEYLEFVVADLVASAIAQVASLAQDKRLIFIRQVGEDLQPLCADEGKLCRALVNLLGNAIKFTPSGGSLTVDVSLTKAGRLVRFSVSDTGEGIPEEAFGRIFEKFGQVESRKSGRNMSTGLGLTFCKLAVEAHGGEIGVESVTGQGSTFWFTIPVLSA